MAQPDVLNPDPQLQAAGYFTNRINVDNDNFGPRLGIAWTPRSDNRTVVRGGFGVFYGRTPSIMIGTAHSNNGINVQTISFTGAAMPTYPNIFPSIPTGSTATTPSIFVFDPNFQNPEIKQYSAGVEQQVGRDFSVGVTWQYVQGDDLPRSRDINVGGPIGTTATIGSGPATIDFTRYSTRPFTKFNRVIAFESSASSIYHGWTLDVQKRFSNNWQARLAWTHSRVVDNKPDATAVVPFSSGDDAKYVSDPLNIRNDYTYGDNDVRDRVVLSGVWSLDSYAQGIASGFWHALASGWTLSSIISYQTGQPYTPNVNSDLNNDGNPSNDIAPGFRRNSLRLPYQFSVDPRVTREIGVYGGARLQLIAEAFNLTNAHNISAYNRAFYSYNATTKVLTPLATFGTATSTSGQRIVQLAAKATF
jgi:hypothetical protein